MQIEGTVGSVFSESRKNRYSTATFPAIRIVGRTATYRYLDWFPDPDRIHRLVEAGDKVRFLSDTPDGNRWIWHLEKDGKVIVSYDEVFAAVRSNRGIDPYLAAGLLVAGLIGSWFYVRSKLRRPVFPTTQDDSILQNRSTP
ncbi:MAG: hypothetical protein JNL39_08290 [Opitutaceae bacterium]|nr:hypothetical protein [Opitutaceae bacterium]